MGVLFFYLNHKAHKEHKGKEKLFLVLFVCFVVPKKKRTPIFSAGMFMGVLFFLFEPQSTQRAQRKRKALLGALRVLCGSNSNLSICINPDVYGAFKLKSVPLI